MPYKDITKRRQYAKLSMHRLRSRPAEIVIPNIQLIITELSIMNKFIELN